MNFLEISPQELQRKLSESPKPFLVDVREPYEFEDKNIGGMNIPMSEILERSDELKQHKEIYLCCASGKRSKVVAYHLSKKLSKQAIFTLIGGLEAYIEIQPI